MVHVYQHRNKLREKMPGVATGDQTQGSAVQSACMVRTDMLRVNSCQCVQALAVLCAVLK